ncbi:MAG TPA: hypothetical protein VK899_10730 [Gemmatimonadales bacterium]|nr:hypothetical protein [Gemmatimonadales bacterium]
MAVRKAWVRERGICQHCRREVALLQNGTIGTWHWPCPGAGERPVALVERRVVPVKPAN